MTAPDITGPAIQAVSDAPDPIYVTQPKGCSPNASIVSASLTDPSGVATAVVIFFHTTIGQVPMTNVGGQQLAGGAWAVQRDRGRRTTRSGPPMARGT